MAKRRRLPHPPKKMNITRRDALRALAGTAALAALPRGRSSETAPLSPAPAPSTGSFRHSACRWCYQKIPLEDLAREAKRIGLESVELLDPADWPVVQRHGLTCAMANGVTRIPEGLNRLEHHAVMVPGMVERIKACADAGLPNVICFSGNRGGMDDELGLANCAIALRQIVGEAEKRQVTVCMELLNSKVNHKDYMFDHIAGGVDVMKRVNSPRVKILFDIYHAQIMDGDIVRNIRDHFQWIGHFHTGGNPGRHEIDQTQELNYPFVMQAIVDLGYTGFVSHEYSPSPGNDPVQTLEKAIEICDV
jgi:hydroxypyruvate isomerase